MVVLIITDFYFILGWVGTISYLLAYFLLSINRLKASQPVYHLLNIVGAIGLTANAINYADIPNVVVNIAWGLIAIFAIIAIRRRVKS